MQTKHILHSFAFPIICNIQNESEKRSKATEKIFSSMTKVCVSEACFPHAITGTYVALVHGRYCF